MLDVATMASLRNMYLKVVVVTLAVVLVMALGMTAAYMARQTGAGVGVKVDGYLPIRSARLDAAWIKP